MNATQTAVHPKKTTRPERMPRPGYRYVSSTAPDTDKTSMGPPQKHGGVRMGGH